MVLIGTAVVLILGGGASVVLLRHWPRAADLGFRTLVVAGSALLTVVSVMVLSGAQWETVSWMPSLPGGAWVVGIDLVSAWFLLLLSLVTMATTIYGVAYLAPERGHRGVTSVHATFAVFVVAMVGVLVARSAVLFLFVWELMALSAYLLMVFEHEKEEVRRAGLLYLVLTHVGTTALLIMFLLWGRTSPDLTFASLAAASPQLPAGGAAILLLALFGFGAKAGLFPLHFWLPGAHASAPSHVSALLSGVMIKTGIYGLLRVVTLSGPPPAWWGWTVLGLGVASAVLGVLWALAQHDLKRVLAYSSVENVGIILLAIGLGVLGVAYHQPLVAVLGFTGALVHSLNHALFKSLLFLGAGAVLHATGTRRIDRLGGLARSMPWTATAFLLGSVAIIGLPPLNGFLGEWITVQGALTAAGTEGALRFAGFAAAVMGLVGALALACFARAGASVFLGQPRSPEIVAREDAPRGMRVGLAGLATGCLVLGLYPPLAVVPASRVAGFLAGGTAAAMTAPALEGGSLQSIAVLGGLLLLAGLIIGLVRIGGARRGRRESGATWGCGYARPTTRMQYTASSFSAPLFATCPAIVSPERRSGARGVETIPQDRVLRGVAIPAWNGVRALALRLRPLQRGHITAYVRYIVWALLLLLAYLSLTGRAGMP